MRSVNTYMLRLHTQSAALYNLKCIYIHFHFFFAIFLAGFLPPFFPAAFFLGAAFFFGAALFAGAGAAATAGSVGDAGADGTFFTTFVPAFLAGAFALARAAIVELVSGLDGRRPILEMLVLHSCTLSVAFELPSHMYFLSRT